MDNNAFESFKSHALQEFPKECCGLLVLKKGRQVYVPCRNISPNRESFEISPEDYAKAEDKGDILAICHSHPNLTSQPSEIDKVSCETSGKTWYIFSLPQEHLNKIEPSGYKADLIGRPYLTNVLDCCTLVQDYYRQELGINTVSLPRYENWWLNEDLLTLDKVLGQGFVLVEHGPKKHDVILMSNSSANGNLNHMAVFVGDEKILHHCSHRLSCHDIYGGYWLKHTRYVVRHKTLC